MKTKEDIQFLDLMGISSIPTNWVDTHENFPRVNHHAGQQLKHDLQLTLENIRRFGKSNNKFIERYIRAYPELIQNVLESMAVISAHEKGSETTDDIKLILNMVLRSFATGEELPKDIKHILARDIREYLLDNPHNKSLGQCLGLERWKSQPKDKYQVPQGIIDLIEHMVFEMEEYNGKFRYPDLAKAQRTCQMKDADKYCEDKEIDLDSYMQMNNQRLPKGSCKSRTFYEQNFDKYKYLALDYILRQRCMLGKGKVKLDADQLKQIKTYWEADVPEVCMFVTGESGSPSKEK